MPIVNHAALERAFTGFKTLFNEGLGQAAPMWNRVAMEVPSTTAVEEYGWLGMLPGLREWIGDRVVHGLLAHQYAIRNRPWELTVGVRREHIEDDQLGVYAPLFREMGFAAAAHPDQLVWSFLKTGFSSTCYDGQYFFDTDHPVLAEDGTVTSVANTDGGSGAAWVLLDARRTLRPVIYQVRKRPEFVRKDAATDDNVFLRGEYLYGVDTRANVGWGLWQMAWGSRQALNSTTYNLARQSMMSLKGDYGRPLGLVPNVLIVPPSLERAGRELLVAQHTAAGATNLDQGTAELVVAPWLA